MAQIGWPPGFDDLAYARWLKERPESIRQMAAAHPPDRLGALLDPAEVTAAVAQGNDRDSRIAAIKRAAWAKATERVRQALLKAGRTEIY